MKIYNVKVSCNLTYGSEARNKKEALEQIKDMIADDIRRHDFYSELTFEVIK